jgi:hypothetical protein
MWAWMDLEVNAWSAMSAEKGALRTSLTGEEEKRKGKKSLLAVKQRRG